MVGAELRLGFDTGCACYHPVAGVGRQVVAAVPVVGLSVRPRLSSGREPAYRNRPRSAAAR